MQGLALTDSNSYFIPQSGQAIDIADSGRNLYSIVQQQKEQIRRLTRYYPSADLSRIGL